MAVCQQLVNFSTGQASAASDCRFRAHWSRGAFSMPTGSRIPQGGDVGLRALTRRPSVLSWSSMAIATACCRLPLCVESEQCPPGSRSPCLGSRMPEAKALPSSNCCAFSPRSPSAGKPPRKEEQSFRPPSVRACRRSFALFHDFSDPSARQGGAGPEIR